MNLRDIWQAAYTAGRVLPKPVATCQYWHRSLDPKKVRLLSRARRLLQCQGLPLPCSFHCSDGSLRHGQLTMC